MPEGPECKLTAEYLDTVLENKAIMEWEFISGQYNEEKLPMGFKQFNEALPLLVEKVSCKGKLIYFVLYNEFGKFYILHSLRMTGRWQEKEDNYCRWYISLDDGKKIWFRNPRCLATLKFTNEKVIFNSIIDKIGPDILTPQFNLDIWKKLIHKHRNKNITSFLMNQNIIGGCGNYIKAEVLYYAKISPLRKVKSLTDEENEQLFQGLIIIPRLSYNYKGLSIKDYTNEYGKKGDYEFKLKIYGQPTATKVKTSDGRITHWDPNRQK